MTIQRIRTTVFALLAGLAISATVVLSQTDGTPTLTGTQKLQRQNLSLQHELAATRAENARGQLVRAVQALARDGWILDLKTMTDAKADATAAPRRRADSSSGSRVRLAPASL